MIDSIRQDVVHAFRMFARAPGFSALVILTMGIGVGGSAAIFTVVNSVLIRPLAFPNPDRLVIVAHTNRQNGQTFGATSPADYLDWRARARSFSSMAAFRSVSFNVSSSERPERVAGAMVTAHFFEVLQTSPAMGRAFRTDDDAAGAERVAVLSDALWRRRFGARTDIIGAAVTLDDETHTVVGVMPPGVEYPLKCLVWVTPHWPVPDDPLAIGQNPSTQRGHDYFSVVARLAPGVPRSQAQLEMNSIASVLERDFPQQNQNVGARLIPLHQFLTGNVRPTLLMLFAAVGLFLLIATANISGLLIARAADRRHEMAVRIAIGASRRRVVGQLLTESTLIALCGGGCGILLANWLIDPLVALSPSDFGARDVQVDWLVLAFGIAVAGASGILFGIAPARESLKLNVHDDLKLATRGKTQSMGARRIRSALVTAQVALCLVLLVCAGLTTKSLIRVQHEPTGFDPSHVLTFQLAASTSRYATPQRKADMWERTLAAVKQVRGINAAGATSRLPLVAGNSGRVLGIKGLQPNAPRPVADYRSSTPGYFRAMGIPFLRGRDFTDADREDRPRVAVVSEAAAVALWPGVDAIGQQFTLTNAAVTVVGVVGDVHHVSLDSPTQPTVYVPYRQDPWPAMTFVLRTDMGPAVADAVRDAVWSVDADQPIGTFFTMDQRLSGSWSRRRFGVVLLSIFATTAAAMAAIGLYGVLSFVVARRRQEIGVRMALGATPGLVIREVLREGLRLAIVGVGIGVALSFVASRLMQAFLYGTSSTDVTIYASAAALLVIVAAMASVLPARRASRVDPLEALRSN